jgi:hypothetical protein
MNYAKLNVKTDSGWTTKYIQYSEEWKFGKYLLKYYAGKEYTWDEIAEENLVIIKLQLGKSKFDKIKWIIID